MKLLASFGCGLAVVGFCGIYQGWAQTRPIADAKRVAEIREYTTWTVVNKEPVRMAPPSAALCRGGNFTARSRPLPNPTQGTQGPHDKKWINVFVNALGEEAMLKQKNPKFHAGTVIAKQKLPSIPTKSMKGEVAGTQPELLTVMVKREAGYDPQNGDWEYMVSDGAGEKVTERGKIASCQGCHQAYKKTDYVVRSYLPGSVSKALEEADKATAPTSDDKKESH